MASTLQSGLEAKRQGVVACLEGVWCELCSPDARSLSGEEDKTIHQGQGVQVGDDKRVGCAQVAQVKVRDEEPDDGEVEGCGYA